MVDPRLVQQINRGRCFALVGSGPSCEKGYPSWRQLAEGVLADLRGGGVLIDEATYRKYLQQRSYPELFRQAEDDLGGRAQLVELVKKRLRRTKDTGFLYDTLARWPFACYLTTNFDDEIAAHLSIHHAYFRTIGNTNEELRTICANSERLIVKLHSDLEHQDQVVLTSRDYQRLSTESAGQYFREKLRQIMQMFTILIVGHSMTDFDLQLVLQVAKETADPHRAVYMFAADLTKGDEKDLLEKYNIIAYSYENSDGDHRSLRKRLTAIDRYITPRGSNYHAQLVDAQEIEAASSLLIYRRLRAAGTFSGSGTAEETLKPLVLRALNDTDANGATVEELTRLEPLASACHHASSSADVVSNLLGSLQADRLVECTSQTYTLTASGRDRIQDIADARLTEEDLSFGHFKNTFCKVGRAANSDEADRACTAFRVALINAFKSRGLALASAIFAGESVHPEDLSDIFRIVSDAASIFPAGDLRVAFATAAHEFLLDPTNDQQAYLESVSQGYFLYHLVGLDPTCSKIRQNVFERTLWVVDSSVILPLLAVGCHNHEYANHLFGMLRRLRANLAVTPKLIREAADHFFWAYSNVPREGYQTTEFVSLALVKGSTKQNLFVDGFIRRAADGAVVNFGEYLESVSVDSRLHGSIESAIKQLGFEHIELDRLFKDSAEAWQVLEDIKDKVKEDRQRRAIYRSDLQVDAEAEVLFFLQEFNNAELFGDTYGKDYDKIYFVSTSRVLDRVGEHQNIRTWTPEALYRYIQTLPVSAPNATTLHQCMLQAYFHAGVSFIDRDRYIRFFGPTINAARLSFESEKNAYVRQLEASSTISADFEEVPDLEKPLYVSQMGWKLAEDARRREEVERLAKEAALARADAAESRMQKLLAERESGWKLKQRRRERQQIATERNAGDLKHIKKRIRQAKARARRNK